jgi:MFS family permease
VSLVGHDVPHYWVGLVLLGAGWNFLFTAGTALLATHYAGTERHRAQGINDLIVFTSQACVSFLAGVAVIKLGWQWTNLSVVPLLALMVWTASRETARPVRAVA